MLLIRQLTFRPSAKPGIVAPLTVRSTGHYRFRRHTEANSPRHFTQIFWVIGGQLEYERCGKWHPAGPGDTFFYKAGEVHRIRADEAGCDYYWLTFDGTGPGQWLEEQFPGAAARKAGKCPVAWFEELRGIISLPSITAEREAASLGLRLLIEFTGSIAPSRETEPSREEDFCQKLEQLIQQNYRDPEFGIQQAAGLMNRHRSSVFRLYREQRGISPSAYLQRMRLRHGLELLRTSGMNITEIAVASGYRDANYFAKIIRRATGEPPKAVRRG